jgi:phosphocarrier protein HPr
MPERTVVVASRTGLHARPAALFVKAAAAQPAKVRLRVGDGKPADARSMLAVLALRVTHGTAVTLEAEGEHADQALDALAELLARDLDAPEPDSAGEQQGSTSAGGEHTGA